MKKLNIKITRKHKALIKVFVALVLIIGVYHALEKYADWRVSHEWQAPYVFYIRTPIKEIETLKPLSDVIAKEPETIITAEVEPSQIWTGEASYYTVDGCIGCNPQRIMANGEVLDDMRKTIAFNLLPMNTEVVVTNLSNGISTTAVVTDTGGFDALGRIADLSFATKKSIDCNDLCQVRIEIF